ncbi:AT-hook motif nuclear-localized protein 17, partial [Mucuna pruriens]
MAISLSQNSLISTPEAYSTSPGMKLVIINVSSGSDVIESIIDFARRGHVILRILSVTGLISSVTLCNTLHAAPALTLHGPFTLLSITSPCIFNNQYIHHQIATPSSPISFKMSLSSSQGQVFGGIIDGRVIAANDVTIVASILRNPELYMYVPKEEGEEHGDNNNNNNPSHINRSVDISSYA